MYSLLFGAIAALAVAALTLGSVPGAVAAFLAVTGFCYLFQPVIALNFADLWIVAVVTLAIAGGLSLFWTCRKEKVGARRTRAAVLTAALAPCLVALLVAVSFFSTASIFHAGGYASLLGKVETIPFEQAVQRLDTGGRAVGSDQTVIDQQSVRQVDRGLAERRAQELIGKDPEFGGTYQHGTMQLTTRNGRLVWAAPLEFNGFFKWLSSDGSPAYVWVDAHDERMADLVKQVDGKPLRMRCTESAYFNQNVERLAWNSFPATATTDYSFELGPDGHPYYVITAYDHFVGFGGSSPTAVIIADPVACTAERHGLDSLPSWVSRVVPSSFAKEQVGDWAGLGGGWLNWSMFGAHANIMEPSPDVELIKTSAGGDTAWYIGLTTPGNPNGTTGFVLVDSRTKKATYFTQAGATEEAAQSAIAGSIAQMNGWTVGPALLYNVDLRATYLSIIKDGSGNFKRVGLMPVDDRNLVVTADDLPTALRLYANALAAHGGRAAGATPSEPMVTVDGTVVRISSQVVDGNTIYLFTIEQQPGTVAVFSAGNGIGPDVALTAAGEKVHVTAHGHDGSLTVDSFENPAIRRPATR